MKKRIAYAFLAGLIAAIVAGVLDYFSGKWIGGEKELLSFLLTFFMCVIPSHDEEKNRLSKTLLFGLIVGSFSAFLP